MDLQWPGRGTFCPVPGLSRTIRDSWSPYFKVTYAEIVIVTDAQEQYSYAMHE